jgi:hypothetical protein
VILLFGRLLRHSKDRSEWSRQAKSEFLARDKARVPLFSLHHTGRRSIRDDLDHSRPGTSRVPLLICSTLQTFANSVGMSEPINTSISTLGAPAANLAACRSEKPTKFPHEHQRRQDSPMDLAGVATASNTKYSSNITTP